MISLAVIYVYINNGYTNKCVLWQDSDKENKLRSSSPVKPQASPLHDNIFTSSSILDTLALSSYKQTTSPTAKHTLSESVSNQRPITDSIPTAQSLRSVSTIKGPLESVEAMNEQPARSNYSPPINTPSPVIIAKHKKTSKTSRRSPDHVTSRDAHRRAHVIKQSLSTFNTRDLPGIVILIMYWVYSTTAYRCTQHFVHIGVHNIVLLIL